MQLLWNYVKSCFPMGWTVYFLTNSLQYSGDGSTVMQKLHGLFSPQIADNLFNLGCHVLSYDIVLTPVTTHDAVRCHSRNDYTPNRHRCENLNIDCILGLISYCRQDLKDITNITSCIYGVWRQSSIVGHKTSCSRRCSSFKPYKRSHD